MLTIRYLNITFQICESIKTAKKLTFVRVISRKVQRLKPFAGSSPIFNAAGAAGSRSTAILAVGPAGILPADTISSLKDNKRTRLTTLSIRRRQRRFSPLLGLPPASPIYIPFRGPGRSK